MSVLQIILILADWVILDNDDGIHYQEQYYVKNPNLNNTTLEQYKLAQDQLANHIAYGVIEQNEVDKLIQTTYYDLENNVWSKKQIQNFLGEGS